jgi:phosphoenolpyruvate carboxykinase (ATP)
MNSHNYDLKELGIQYPHKVYYNLFVPDLVERALARHEGVLTEPGALSVRTGKFTGRSPEDKYIVEEEGIRDEIWWRSTCKRMSEKQFSNLYEKAAHYLEGREVFIFEGFAGADESYRVPIRVITEYAWHSLFIHQLLIRPSADELKEFKEQFTVICVPGCRADSRKDGTSSETFIAINFSRRILLIGGTSYAGEIKKGIFTIMNYLLPKRRILSMHCSANVSSGGEVALFFGLSGTGKTSLSADPERKLIGDDEHGWSDEGIFNIEGGCYAKCINLSKTNEPQIWDAIRFGTVLENVVTHSHDRALEFDDARYTENTRAGYPIDFIPQAVIPGVAGHPKHIIFLTADAFGVMPPVALLNREQIMYYFLQGYTSKLAGTERGITEPVATFSSCFGAPFLPMPPQIYAQMLDEKISRYNTSVFLINTGWTGGPYGTGERISIAHTRAMVKAVLDGTLSAGKFLPDPVFNLMVPATVPGVPESLLQPHKNWQDKRAYDRQAQELVQLFAYNYKKQEEFQIADLL